MPVLPSLPEPVIKQFYLPSTSSLPQEEQGWVKMDVSPMNVQDRLSAEAGETPVQASIRILATRIREWNFTEADGSAAAITPVSVLRLGDANLNYLAAQISVESDTALSAAQKKS